MTKQEPYQLDKRTPFTALTRAQQERLLLALIYTTWLTTSLLAIPYGIITVTRSGWQGPVVNALQVPMVAILIISLRMVRRGRIELAGYILFPYLLFLIGVNAVMTDAVDSIAPSYLALVVTASIVLGPSGNSLTALVALVLWGVALFIDEKGLVAPAPLPNYMSVGTLLSMTGLSFFFVAILNHGATNRMQRALTNANYALVEANRQLREASQLKSRFVARVSHDLRTPLNAIMLTSDLIRRRLYGPLSAKQEEALDRVLFSTRHLEALINDILDISKIEAGQLELADEAIEVTSLVEAVQATLEHKAREKGLVLLVNLAPNMPGHILGDRDRLIQILVNLTDNAIKYTDEGEVSASIEPVEDKHWRMVVRDTGRGIHDKDLDVIFEEFRQVDRSPRGSGGGAGLGLAITRHLVDLMKGEISVDSKLGKGSTFEVTLPLRLEN